MIRQRDEWPGGVAGSDSRRVGGAGGEGPGVSVRAGAVAQVAQGQAAEVPRGRAGVLQAVGGAGESRRAGAYRRSRGTPPKSSPGYPTRIAAWHEVHSPD